MSSEVMGRLAQAIVSEQEWVEVCHLLNRAGHTYVESVEAAVFSVHTNVPTRVWIDSWFWCREKTRMDLGIYKTSNVVAWLNSVAPGYYIHNGRDEEDLSMVSYVPGVEDAKRDKRHKIKLGRLIVRLCPLLTDDYVRDLVTAHTNEVDPNIELLYGAENIRKIYTTGPGACMSKDLKEYQTTDRKGNRYSPTDVYDMPHIAVAVTRDSKGVCNGRALVLPEKKIYIRATYGSPVLKAKLEAAGYVPGTFCGTELKLIELDRKKDGSIMFVIPYIDGNGGAGRREHSTVAIVDGKLKVLHPRQIERATNRGLMNKFYLATNTSGSGWLQPSTAADFEQVDTITGKPISEETSTVKVFYQDRLHETSVDTWAGIVGSGTEASTTAVHWDTAGNSNRVSALRSDVFVYMGQTYTKATTTLTNLGLVRLDPAYYGEWRAVPHNRDIVIPAGSVYGLRRKDSRCIIILKNDEDDAGNVVAETEDTGAPYPAHLNVTQRIESTYEHSSIPTKGRKLVQVHTVNGTKTFAAEGVTVVKTSSGRKAVPGFHQIYRTWDGGYVLATGKHSSVEIANITYVHTEKTTPAELRVGGAAHRKAFIRAIEREAESVTSPLNFDRIAASMSIRINGNAVSGWGHGVRHIAEARIRDQGVTYDVAIKSVVRDILDGIDSATSFDYADFPADYRVAVKNAFEDAYCRLFYSAVEARAIDYTEIEMHNSLPVEVVVTEEAPIEVEVVNA